MKKIFLIFITLIISGCPSTFEEEDKKIQEEEDPEYFGVWVKEDADGSVKKIEINKYIFLEQNTDSDGEITYKYSTNHNNYSVLPKPNYWTSVMNQNKNFYWEMTFVIGINTTYEVIDGNILKIGGGDIIYSRVSDLNDSIEGKWRWESEQFYDDGDYYNYIFDITFILYQNSNSGEGIFVIEFTYLKNGEYYGWLGTQGRFNTGEQKIYIYLSSHALNRKLFIIKNDKMTLSNYFFDNGKIKEYNDNNPVNIDCEMFGLLYGLNYRQSLYNLQDYFAEEYNRK